jgi:hypothetical protein
VIVDHGEQPLDPPDAAPNGGVVVWLFGCGLSIECGLKWTEPAEWKARYSRMERIEKIKREIRVQMDSSHVDPAPIREFLTFLKQNTVPEWRHLFITTNWDYVLQRELRAMVEGLVVPQWLDHGGRELGSPCERNRRRGNATPRLLHARGRFRDGTRRNDGG